MWKTPDNPTNTDKTTYYNKSNFMPNIYLDSHVLQRIKLTIKSSHHSYQSPLPVDFTPQLKLNWISNDCDESADTR